MRAFTFLFTLTIATVVFPYLSFAAPNSFMIQGQIFRPDGAPLEEPSVLFTVKVLSDTDECLLYEEVHTINMNESEGRFNLKVGKGSRTSTGGMTTINAAMDNSLEEQSSLDCVNGNEYDPSLLDSRKLRITFDDGSGPITLPEDHNLVSYPYALHAGTLAGKTVDKFLHVNTDTSGLDQTVLELVFDGDANYNELLALIGGTSTKYTGKSDNGAGNLPGFTTAVPPASPAAGDIWFNTTTNKISYFDGVSTHDLGVDSSSEVNTASNQGLGGVGVFRAKNVLDLEFKNINAGSNKVTVSDDAGNVEIDIDVDESNFDLSSIPNTAAGNIAATNAQAAINELDAEKLSTGFSSSVVLRNGSQGLTANWDLGGAFKITNLPTPTLAGDAASKSYVDSTVLDDRLRDDDGNTLVQVEESSNDNTIRFDTDGVERMVISSTGQVGIGAPAPAAALDVRGSIRSVSSTGGAYSNASTVVDWSRGNAQEMTVACTATSFSEMLDGGVYTLAVTDTTATICVFTHAGLTFYYNPVNQSRVGGVRTIYTFQRIGTSVYVSWVSGFTP